MCKVATLNDEEVLLLPHIGRYKGEKVSFEEEIGERSIGKIFIYSQRPATEWCNSSLMKGTTLSPMKYKEEIVPII